MRVAAVVLAAGESRRMKGVDKLTLEVHGVPLLRHVAEQIVASDVDDVVIVLGAHEEARRDALDGLSVVTVQNNDWPSGMASSVCAGIGAIEAQSDAAIIILGDMPDVDAALINKLIAAFSSDELAGIVVPRTASGQAGNPVLFARHHFPALMELAGDRGARGIIDDYPDQVRHILADEAVLTDLDTPESWESWRNGKRDKGG